MRARHATRERLGLERDEYAELARLNTPEKIQRFLYELPLNFERDGDTCLSVRQVLRERRAHCIEGALVAACALWIHGEPPLLLDLAAVRDYDHVVALFRRNGCWGAISKTNGVGLRWRDPVYRSLRELAMSYFHEYYNARHEKTLRRYSLPFDLRRFDPRDWVSGEDGAWKVAGALDRVRHFRLLSPAQARTLAPRDPFERRASRLLQYGAPKGSRFAARGARRG
ncbi:MAG: hypothetical protein N2653_10860 [Burkholderiales bacterium]|nr:hypothetical protein [Burkholderiales bacterium]